MEKAFFVESIKIVDVEKLGKFIQIEGSPYEHTPFGVSKNYFKAVIFNLPYKQNYEKLGKPPIKDDLIF